MRYAEIKNNEIEKIHDRLHGGFVFEDGTSTGSIQHYDDAMLSEKGIYPIVENKPNHNTDTHHIVEDSSVFDGKSAIINWVVKKIPVVEIKNKIRNKRREKYPDIGDQVDAILKQLNQDRLNGHPMITEMDDILGKWLKVKADNPLPK